MSLPNRARAAVKISLNRNKDYSDRSLNIIEDYTHMAVVLGSANNDVDSTSIPGRSE